MSLCGDLLGDAESQEDTHAIFSEHIVTFEYFRENPAALLADRNLMFLIDGKICPFSPEIQAYFVSRVLFPNSPPLPLHSSSMTSSPFSFQAEGGRTQQSNSFRDQESGDFDEERLSYDAFNERVQIDSAFIDDNSPAPSAHPNAPIQVPDDSTSESFHRKTLQPTQEDLLKMDLRYGTNDIEFVVHTTSSEAQEMRVSARLYYWPISAKIVIAEIDGAVSRIASSGMFSNLLSSGKVKERSGLHHGALEFYSKLARNGYRIVYLTCRGLSQAELMHGMLRPSSDRKLALPNGPVLLAPDRLLATNSNEVIEARDFKVAALNGIRALFPSDVNPFYAAFGRTFADSVVLTQVGVFPGKVFLVDEGDGRLRHKSMMNFQESYSSLIAMLDKMFPPLCSLSPRRTLSSKAKGTGNSLSSPSSSTTSAASQSEEERIPGPPLSSSSSTMKRIYSVADDLVSEVISSQARTRSMGDEAYNDLNFWKIRPGRVDGGY